MMATGDVGSPLTWSTEREEGKGGGHDVIFGRGGGGGGEY